VAPDTPWAGLQPSESGNDRANWLDELLTRNAHTAYLRQFGSPKSMDEFRENVPLCRYEDLVPHIERLRAGESDVLFRGRPVAFEKTGGSSGGSKLIPYSTEGLADFQAVLVPWLARTVRRHEISGSAYFSISPATRKPEQIGQVPVGLPDSAYLGETAGRILFQQTAVPFEVGAITDVEQWRKQTIEHLRAARDLELISVWSPTFLLSLLNEVGDTKALWPRLKVISCWAGGAAARYLPALRRLFPHAAIEPKGLVSTEAVVTTPSADGRPVLAERGFFEFLDGDRPHLENELADGRDYEVVVTTASGLYRYRTGDRVRCDGRDGDGRPVLQFIGRDNLTSDLVGEKLTDTFVASCLEKAAGFAMLVPDGDRRAYVLIAGFVPTPAEISMIDEALCANPQYAYARRIGQLNPLRVVVHPRPLDVLNEVSIRRGIRLGDIKPTALRVEDFWLHAFEER
jgi:hypothetical protein